MELPLPSVSQSSWAVFFVMNVAIPPASALAKISGEALAKVKQLVWGFPQRPFSSCPLPKGWAKARNAFSLSMPFCDAYAESAWALAEKFS
jgi:hypothetical protein